MFFIFSGLVMYFRQNVVRKSRDVFRGYPILNRDFDRRNLSSVIDLISWSSSNLKTPKMMHFVLEIEDPDVFDTNRFCQRFKEKLFSCLRERNRERNKKTTPRRTKLPNIELFFSIESKYIRESPLPYLHLHLMVIFDTNHNDYGYKELSIAVTRALSNIPGLESLAFDPKRTIFLKGSYELKYGFLKFRNEKSSVRVGSFKNLYWHDLKTELADAVCRASYLCKLDQKEMLPIKFQRGNSFGHTRPKGIIKPSDKLPSSLPIGSQLSLNEILLPT